MKTSVSGQKLSLAGQTGWEKIANLATKWTGKAANTAEGDPKASGPLPQNEP